MFIARRSGDEEPDDLFEFVEFERFGEYAGDSACSRIVFVEGAVTGHEDDWRGLARVVLDCGDDTHAIAVGEVEVQQDKVEG
jgi:hypothetical protein